MATAHDSGAVDYRQLYERLQDMLFKLLLSGGALWAALREMPELRDELIAQMGQRGPVDVTGVQVPPAVLLACADKMTEINGDAWRSSPGELKASFFEPDEYIVKYPDSGSEATYYFRVRGGEVTVLHIE